jgi:hypothetical protein
MTPHDAAPYCPECAFGPDAALARRDFIRLVGTSAAAVAVAGTAAPAVRAADKPAKAAKPAEGMIRELFAGLSADQKKQVVLPWDHGAKGGSAIPTRLGMYNAPIAKLPMKDCYTKTQQELLDRIFRAICSDDDGYKRMSRGGTFDDSKSFDSIGALLFGEPTDDKPYSLVFAGHHLTVRCDGNSEPGAAFGGPMYYGHTPNGYSDRNVFYYQTKEVLTLFDALEGKQRKAAVLKGTPGEQAPSVRFRKDGEPHPGLAVREMTPDQRELVERVMRAVLSPYRKEDADEVMDIVKANGGMDAIHFAFYEDKEMTDRQPWHFWRLEGPGFVWNFRVLPHVHTYVHIRNKA